MKRQQQAARGDGGAAGFTDVATLRARARRDIDEGAITESYRANRGEILRLLNDALATEIVCWMRYKRHQYMAKGPQAEAATAEFEEHANQELEHADWLATRIVQLGGAPDYSPNSLAARSHSEYVEGSDLRSMLREDLVAERIAIDSYREIIQFIGDADPTTRRLFEQILAVEEEHADDLANLMAGDTSLEQQQSRT